MYNTSRCNTYNSLSMFSKRLIYGKKQILDLFLETKNFMNPSS